MNRRDFIRRAPLVVAASALAVEEVKRGWVRRFFPGFGPGTITRRLRYQGDPYGTPALADLLDAQRELNEAMKRIYADPLTAHLTEYSELMDAFVKPLSLYLPRTDGGLYMHLEVGRVL